MIGESGGVSTLLYQEQISRENQIQRDQGAVREVEEETGVTGLSITKPLQTTYHIFKRNGKHRIKVTYWFEMVTSYDGKFHPQIKEGITKVKWLNKQESIKALNQSYANIRVLI